VGESITEVFVGTWLKGEGDAVARDEAIVEIETDKATLEVAAPVDGVLAGILKQSGASAAIGEVIARVEPAAAGEAPAPPPPTEDAAASEAAPSEAAAQPEATGAPSAPSDRAPVAAEAQPAGAPTDGDVRVMPAARRLLDAHGLRAGDIEATGPGGRLLKEDVERHLARANAGVGARAPGQAAAPAGAGTQAGGAAAAAAADLGPTLAGRHEEAVPMTTLRRRIAERLVEAQHTAALLTTFNEIDMSAIMALRAEYRDAFEKRHGVRLGFMSFFVKAAVDALKATPQINAEIRGTDMVFKDYYDIGVAVSTQRGLVVPVLRDAERMSFAEIEKAIGDFGKRAQAGRLTPDELQGGTFTITNGGVFGSLLSTPIVNPPQSGVLGMHAIQQRPVAIAGAVEIRPMMYVALTYDHRIVDGREAVTFLKRIKEAIENPARMLMEV
jgi:2-oxoglutarate dehydrogenase E2 component (dihydrolipoamide succinyltransferase)